jgi:tripartite-type tricarboxylate transporter receptor subunit TctC
VTLTRRQFCSVQPLRRSRGSGARADWPTGPIRLIIPFPPGGSDRHASHASVQTGLQQRLGVNIIIENKAGRLGRRRHHDGREVAARRQHLAVRVRHALGQSVFDEPAVRHREGP